MGALHFMCNKLTVCSGCLPIGVSTSQRERGIGGERDGRMKREIMLRVTESAEGMKSIDLHAHASTHNEAKIDRYRQTDMHAQPTLTHARTDRLSCTLHQPSAGSGSPQLFMSLKGGISYHQV